ncbi:hypothetical protein [Paenibacillus sp. J2TS4]|uniref:hypothetical protein n=1 Tax=Paenibacillus sp. J2TS4 TaxID=2807194 RepID=UPI001BCD8BB6|nr:hypothetical protein [Paenibacillus sp. J2TS4]
MNNIIPSLKTILIAALDDYNKVRRDACRKQMGTPPSIAAPESLNPPTPWTRF